MGNIQTHKSFDELADTAESLVNFKGMTCQYNGDIVTISGDYFKLMGNTKTHQIKKFETLLIRPTLYPIGEKRIIIPNISRLKFKENGIISCQFNEFCSDHKVYAKTHNHPPKIYDIHQYHQCGPNVYVRVDWFTKAYMPMLGPRLVNTLLLAQTAWNMYLSEQRSSLL
jgi:hypothetical protein